MKRNLPTILFYSICIFTIIIIVGFSILNHITFKNTTNERFFLTKTIKDSEGKYEISIPQNWNNREENGYIFYLTPDEGESKITVRKRQGEKYKKLTKDLLAYDLYLETAIAGHYALKLESGGVMHIMDLYEPIVIPFHLQIIIRLNDTEYLYVSGETGIDQIEYNSELIYEIINSLKIKEG